MRLATSHRVVKEIWCLNRVRSIDCEQDLVLRAFHERFLACYTVVNLDWLGRVGATVGMLWYWLRGGGGGGGEKEKYILRGSSVTLNDHEIHCFPELERQRPFQFARGNFKNFQI